jgi:hypothetical protein
MTTEREEPKYTEPPWTAHRGIERHVISGGRAPDPVTEARYLWIAEVYDRDSTRSGSPGWRYLTPEEAQANADLIRAAPYLLANVEHTARVLDAAGLDSGSDLLHSGLRNALAEGREAARYARGEWADSRWLLRAWRREYRGE